MSRFVVMFIAGVVATNIVSTATAQVADKDIAKMLTEGRLADGATAMQTAIKSNSNDHAARFGLGIVQFLQAVEGLGQDQFRYGLLGNRRQAIPFMRLPIPENDAPEQISYEKFRAIIQNMVTRLATAEATLAAVKPAGVKLPIPIGQIRLDLNADGIATDEESLWNILEGLQNGGRNVEGQPDVNQLVIAFDDADVLWLRGYCHVMGAMGEVMLAYDGSDQFERTFHLFYPNVESPYPHLQSEGPGPLSGFNGQNILDVIALIHTVNYEVREPERMKTALAHLESVVTLSRDSWRLINAETDNDREWLPNANQTAAFGGMTISAETQESWQAFLNEAELILQGKKLLPYWRGIEGGFTPFDNQFPANAKVGINLRRVFTEPARFDLILWLQGTAQQQYLEEGEQTDPDFWRETMTGFRGQFFLFLVWFN